MSGSWLDILDREGQGYWLHFEVYKVSIEDYNLWYTWLETHCNLFTLSSTFNTMKRPSLKNKASRKVVEHVQLSSADVKAQFRRLVMWCSSKYELEPLCGSLMHFLQTEVTLGRESGFIQGLRSLTLRAKQSNLLASWSCWGHCYISVS